MAFFMSRPLHLFNCLNITKNATKNVYAQKLLTNTIQIPEGRKISSHSFRKWKVNLDVQDQKPCYISIRKHRFHTSGQQQAVPPLIWMVIKPLAKIGAILTGRTARTWLRSRPKVERIFYCRRILFGCLGGLAFGGLVGLVYYYSHMQEVPVTNRKRFITLTPEQMLKVSQFEADAYHEQFQKNTVSSTDPRYKRVVAVTEKLVMSNLDIPMLKSQKWVITIVESKDINAFVLPTGDIFVNTGLLELAANDDQLAVVLGHEMAHAVLSHAAEQISFSQLIDFLIIAVMAAIWTIMPNDGIAIVTQWFYNKVMNLTVHMPYSRLLEKEADQVGLQLTAKACFDVRQGSVFWSKMKMLSELKQEFPIEFLSTHPAHEKRVKHIDHLVPKLLEVMKDCKCPPLSTKDPREEVAHVQEIVTDTITAMKARQNLSNVKTIALPQPKKQSI
ncbi:hypothetical protein CHS0354_036871 [Potamilus streckersoni]|uniref:Metalloendopeptidase OMA1, mitochondrial n=1 Tax=Potamilus streckersoni TaxID=2493646 RepID=A0AAE0VLY1_9BIVA|nr:hypothetical protein CHS0354_036871 [Potamilus streckersoni]